MPATPAIIGFCLTDARVARAGPDATVAAQYGDLARVTDEPVETFFDSMNDVQQIATDRLNLLKGNRRRFQAEIQGESTGLGLTFKPTTPAATFIDDERAANMATAVVELGIDFETGRTALVLWG